MNIFWNLLLFISLNLFYISALDETSIGAYDVEDTHNEQVAKNKLAVIINAVIDHYKKEDPIGFPGADVPDPMPVPDIKKSFGLGKMVMSNVLAHGCSKFRITQIKTDLNLMKVDAVVEVDQIIIDGKYVLNAFLSKDSGSFRVTAEKVKVQGFTTLSVRRDGGLETDTIKMDIHFGNMAVDFQNLGFTGSMFQSLINTAPNLVFDSIKPFMLKEVDTKLRPEIDKTIKNYMKDIRLPNSITPLDMSIALARKKVRQMNFDPYIFPNYNRTTGIFSIYLENTWVSGLSSFYRVGDVLVSMEDKTLQMQLHIGTQQLSGAAQWQVSCGLVSRYGQIQFKIDHLKLKVVIQQPLDTTKKPKINDLQLELGNIQVRCKGAGTFDYMVEFLVNIVPNLLRYQIMDALENPLKTRIQEKFDSIDVELMLKNAAQQFEAGNTSLPFNFNL